ncbi:hypothetical protein DFH07DRAFT_871647 [Mycena maculata]|uniref:DUF7779 domain-containing protein n=1 Tax=Mycena maculata TaxID=230809 RepID=A0AAD7HRG4_9AGAR|nr:hypothetical protein DFH07DRAFT_871647 [Mycena maculata]
MDYPTINLQQFIPRCKHGNILITTRNPELCISFEHLTKQAAQFLQLYSFLHHEGIAESMFSHATWDHLSFTEVIGEIRSYSLMELDPHKGTYSIHPLVQDWTRSNLTDAHWDWMCTVTLIGMSVPFGEQVEDYQFRIQLLPHVDSLLSNDMAKESDVNFQFIFGRAADLEAMVLEKRKQFLGGEHPDTLLAMGNLAASLKALVLEKRKQLLGEDHPDTLLTMANLAYSYQAADLEVMVLEKRKQLLGEEHPATLLAMANLACSYLDVGRSQEAVDLETIVLEKMNQLLGGEHPDTLLAMGNLAASYAVDLETIVLERMKGLLGEEHPHTLLAMANLASSYHLETIVLEKRKQLLGEDHPETLRAMGNLACSYVDLETILLGVEHPDTLTALRNLAASYQLVLNGG